MYKAIPYKIGIIGVPGAGKTRLLNPLQAYFAAEGYAADPVGAAHAQRLLVQDGNAPLSSRPALDSKGRLKTEVLAVEETRENSLLHIEFHSVPGDTLADGPNRAFKDERRRLLKSCSLQIVVINPFHHMDQESKMEYIVRLATSIENPPKGAETISAFSVIKACEMIGGAKFWGDHEIDEAEQTQLQARIIYNPTQKQFACVQDLNEDIAEENNSLDALMLKARRFLSPQEQIDPVSRFIPEILYEIEKKLAAGIPCLLMYSHLDIFNRINESIALLETKIIQNENLGRIRSKIDNNRIKGIFKPVLCKINPFGAVEDNAPIENDTHEFLRELKNNIGLGVRRRLKRCLVINLAVALGTIGLWTVATDRGSEEFIIFSALLSLLHLATCVVLGPFTFCWQIALLPLAGWAAIFAFVINNLNGRIYSIDEGWFHAVFLLQTLICIFSGAYSEDDGASILKNWRRTTGP